MTIKEYISSSLGDLISPSKIDLLVKKVGKPETEEANADDIDLVLYENVMLIIPFNQSISEGGVSLTYNLDALKLWYSLLAKKLGKENLILSQISGITDITNKW